jgi:threonine synthase
VLPVHRQPGQRRRRGGRPRGLGLRGADPSSLEQAKILTTAVYGGTLLAVDGNYDDVNRLATELAGRARGLGVRQRQRRPYYAEGSKTLGFEVAEQLGWRLPEQIVVPVASGRS